MVSVEPEVGGRSQPASHSNDQNDLEGGLGHGARDRAIGPAIVHLYPADAEAAVPRAAANSRWV